MCRKQHMPPGFFQIGQIGFFQRKSFSGSDGNFGGSTSSINSGSSSWEKMVVWKPAGWPTWKKTKQPTKNVLNRGGIVCFFKEITKRIF